MHDLFATIPESLRQHQLQQYEQYLIDRDGEMNLDARTLQKREEKMARYEAAPECIRGIDTRRFREQYAAFDRHNPPSRELCLLLSLVKVNAAEAYGVSRAYQRTLDRALRNGDQAELRILCEEGYHTRILLSSTNLYGIQVDQAYTPPSALRVMIGGITNLPDAITRPLVLASEILATIMFVRLLELAGDVLKNAPEVRDAIEERLLEICVDERGHMSYNRLLMGPATLAQTRIILPAVAATMRTAFPELVALGAFPDDVLADLALVSDPRRMPASMRQESFLA